MLSRVVNPSETTYGFDYQRKNVRKEIGKNLSTAITTGVHYRSTPKTLYGSDISEASTHYQYSRPVSNRLELLKYPPDYQSTVKPSLEPPTLQSNYQQFFGTPGYVATNKPFVTKSRSLSKQTRAEIEGTTRSTHHPPGYTGHIPHDTNFNRGKYPHEDRNLQEMLYQYRPEKTGYSGYVPEPQIVRSTQHLNRTPTTYRDMCDEIGYIIKD